LKWRKNFRTRTNVSRCCNPKGSLGREHQAALKLTEKKSSVIAALENDKNFPKRKGNVSGREEKSRRGTKAP